MALTEDALVDRIRQVCEDLEYVEAVQADFSKQPVDAIDGRFIVQYRGDVPIGHIGMHEEARGAVIVSVARSLGNDHIVARRTALEDARTILKAVLADGISSGEYAIEDPGRTVEVDSPTGASYLIGRVRIPVNFEALLE